MLDENKIEADTSSVKDSISILKQNIKVPTSMKLVALVTNRYIEIYRKKLNNEYESTNALFKVLFEESLEVEIIRHSNNLLVLKSLSKNNIEIHITLESSY